MKKRDSKRILADTLIEMSKRTPFDRLTVKSIVKEAGLSPQTFYNHFRDKYELILWVHMSEFEDCVSRLGKDGYGFPELMRDNLRFYTENRDFIYNAITNTQGYDSYALRSAAGIYSILKDHFSGRKDAPSPDEETDFQLRMYCFGTVTMTVDWMFNQNRLSEDDFLGYMDRALPEKLKQYLYAI